MVLYQLARDFSELYDWLDAIDPEEEGGGELLEAFLDTLEGLEGELNLKAENVALFIKSLDGDAAALRAEEQALQKRRRAKEQKAARLRAYLQHQLEAAGKKRVESPRVVVSLRKNPPSVLLENEAAVVAFGQANHAGFLVPQPPKVDKLQLKKALQSGLCVTGARLSSTQSLQIR